MPSNLPMPTFPSRYVTLRFARVLLAGACMTSLACKTSHKATQKPVDNKLVIVKAAWGDVMSEHMVDVTKTVAGLVKNNALRVEAKAQIFGDPAAFKLKHLRVEWSKGGVVAKKHAMENGTIAIAADEQPVPIRLIIRKAIYGNFATGQTRDVTMNVADLVQDNTLSITPNNSLFGGDPAEGQAKQLSVDYTFDGVAKSKVADETHPLTISATGQ